MRESHASGVAFTVLLLCRVASLQNCVPGWFGPDCQYASHCSNATCDLDFSRHIDSMCTVGWFGPGCQYVDLVPWSIDKPLPTRGYRCLQTNEPNAFMVLLKTPYVITWIRIEVAPSDTELNISIVTSAEVDTYLVLKCKQIRLTETIVDVFCEPGMASRDVIIRGPDVSSVCTFFISGGRNVALKQETWQSSTQYHEDVPLESRRAVDGNTNGYLRNTEKSCSNTAPKDKNPVWGIRFKTPKRIYQFVLHNRDAASLLIRLKGFTVTFYSEDDKELFSYTDAEDTPLEEYIVSLQSAVKPVKHIQIRAAPQPNENNEITTILSLCEVEIYGDSVCPLGTFGFECEHTCSCSVSNKTCVDGKDGCQTGSNVSLCLKACQEGRTLPDYTAESGIILFVGVGVGIAVLAIIIIIIIVVVAVRFSRRTTKTIQPHVYNVTSFNGQYNHEYNVNFRPETSNDETRLKRAATSPTNYECPLYDEVNDQYVEFE